MRIKDLNLALLFLPFAAKATAQEISVFPKGFIVEAVSYHENDDFGGGKVGGCTVHRKSDVGDPSFTIYRAAKPNGRGMSVVVCPGGGYNLLAYDLEGSEICEMLNRAGYDAVLLKYRVPRRPGRAKHEAPLEDMQRTLSLLRTNGSEYGVASERIGVIGFSAGAHLSVMACCNSRIYEAIDKVDEASCHPDFCALIYPAYLSGEQFGLAEDVCVGPITPPTFIVQSQDDTSHVNSSLFYYYALKEAKVAATMHLYSSGGHGYGIRKTGHPSQEWWRELVVWLGEV